MEGMVSFGNSRSYDDFKKQIPLGVQPLFDSLRDFCLALGNNVVEDVRMHRVVFGKSMTFRWFADIEPQNDGVIIKIQKNRKEQPKVIQIKINEDPENFKKLVKKAFESIY